MNLQPEVVEEGLRRANEIRVYGVPLKEMSHDELLAIAALGWYYYIETVSRRARDPDFVGVFRSR